MAGMGRSPNLERMIRLVDEFFQARSDPEQISVTEEEREKLAAMHPATLSEERTEDGPVAWVLVVPTTRVLMEEFLARRITERELLARTPLTARYDALYLCSAIVLPEYRRKGLARRLTVEAARAIALTYPITVLFTWSFSEEGRRLAEAVAKDLELPLRERTDEGEPPQRRKRRSSGG